MKLLLRLLLCIAGIELLGSIGAIFTVASITDWYAPLAKPPGTPPDAVFSPVWITLYAMIGGSLALVWSCEDGGNSDPKKGIALVWFGIQMFLNLSWSPIFFGLHWTGVALGVITVLWIAIVITIFRFYPISRLAAWLLVPYLLWTGYAAYLNAGFFLLNR